MKKLLLIINKKITVGAMVGALGSLLFAVLLKYGYEHLYLITPMKGGISIYDLSFFGLVVLFRFLFGALLEYFMGDIFFITISDVFLKPNGGNFMMEENNTNSTSSKPDNNKGQSSSSNTSSELDPDLSSKLFKDMQDNLEMQWRMIKKLDDIKLEGVKLFGYKGDLDIEVPSEFTHEKGQEIAKQVGITDRILKTKFSEYKELKNKDSTQNNGQWSSLFENMRKFHKEEYKKLFEK